MSEIPKITGPAGDWLASRRDELNARFRTAKRRFSKLDAQAVLMLNAELLPPLAGNSEEGVAELLSEIFDLILLHSGRGLLSLGPSPMRVLLSETFPLLRTLLLQRPRALPSALSNAVENLGVKGTEFARAMGAMAGQLQNAEQVCDAGALLAWRLGEARLREQALHTASQLPGSVALMALGLDGWPAATAPLALGALIGDAWCNPRERIRPQTLMELADAPREKIVAMLEKLGDTAPTASTLLSHWRPGVTCGEFAGFGGNFIAPPQLLYVGKMTHRHRFWVRSGTENYRIDADIFGWVCKPDPTADYPIQKTASRVGVGAVKVSSLKATDKPMLFWDGVLFSRGKVIQINGLTSASSYCVADDTVAATQYDSYRIRVYSPTRSAL